EGAGVALAKGLGLGLGGVELGLRSGFEAGAGNFSILAVGLTAQGFIRWFGFNFCCCFGYPS
ncbi:MAG TPA: hypothetical protein DCP31_09165, partial [Cyanobacteria bacterium UBA8543]|nr:hypothetical protein [Cyanobacteria bacterium UBA8543]